MAKPGPSLINRAHNIFENEFDDWMLKQAEEARVFCGELGTSMARAILLQGSAPSSYMPTATSGFDYDAYEASLLRLVGPPSTTMEDELCLMHVTAMLGCSIAGLASFLSAKSRNLARLEKTLSLAVPEFTLAQLDGSEDAPELPTTADFSKEHARLEALAVEQAAAAVAAATAAVDAGEEEPAVFPLRSTEIFRESEEAPIYDMGKGWNVLEAPPGEEDKSHYAVVDKPPPLPAKSFKRKSQPSVKKPLPVSWFHGAISREVAEERMTALAPDVPGQVVYLARNKSNSRHDLVVSAQRYDPVAQRVATLHLPVVVNVDNNGVPCSCTFNAPFIPQSPKFRTISDAIEFLKRPFGPERYWLPLGPPLIPVPTPISGPVPLPTAASAALRRPTRMQQAFNSRPQWIDDDETSSQYSYPQTRPLPNGGQSKSKEGIYGPVYRVRDGQGPSAQQQQRTPQQQAPAQPAQQTPEPTTQLVCEGYLLKVRGVAQNKKRYFRLTTQDLSFFTKDADDVIDTVNLSNVAAIVDVEKSNRLRVLTKTPFGASHQTEMTLEAPNRKVKTKWIKSLKAAESTGKPPQSDLPGELKAEGYITKLAPFGSSNRTRWFKLTDKKLALYKEEEGEEMASIELEHITTVGTEANDQRTFKIITNRRFTAGGHFEVQCKCDTNAIRNRWLVALRQVIPAHKFQR